MLRLLALSPTVIDAIVQLGDPLSGIGRDDMDHRSFLLDGKVSDLIYDRLTVKLENDLQLIREEEIRLAQVNSDYFQKGLQVLELCKGLETVYLTKSFEEQRDLAKLMCKNITTDGLSLFPTYKKPFDVLASRAGNEEWCPLGDSKA